MIIFALNLAYQEMTVREWIREKEINGTSTFSVEELRSCFIASSEQVIKNELYRLKMQGKILSVYKGFYVIVPIQYAAKRIVLFNMGTFLIMMPSLTSVVAEFISMVTSIAPLSN